MFAITSGGFAPLTLGTGAGVIPQLAPTLSYIPEAFSGDAAVSKTAEQGSIPCGGATFLNRTPALADDLAKQVERQFADAENLPVHVRSNARV